MWNQISQQRDLAYVTGPHGQVASKPSHTAWKFTLHAMDPWKLDVQILAAQAF